MFTIELMGHFYHVCHVCHVYHVRCIRDHYFRPPFVLLDIFVCATISCNVFYYGSVVSVSSRAIPLVTLFIFLRLSLVFVDLYFLNTFYSDCIETLKNIKLQY